MTRPRRSRRLILAVAASLLGGVLVSVAVAVGFALWGTVRPETDFLGYWVAEEQGSKPWAWALERLPRRAEGFGVIYSSVGIRDGCAFISPGEPITEVVSHQTGWPLRCLEYRYVGPQQADGSWPHDPTGWEAPSWLVRAEYGGRSTRGRPPLPVRPLPLGLAADSALYGSLLFGACALVGVGRRALRRRRGQCPRCAYSRDGLAAGVACPECGAPPTPLPAA